jgi:hypothetical protein
MRTETQTRKKIKQEPNILDKKKFKKESQKSLILWIEEAEPESGTLKSFNTNRKELRKNGGGRGNWGNENDDLK